MRISDWSSDVCSSDLRPRDRRNLATLERGRSTQQAFGNRDVVVACKIPCAICQRDRANRGGRARQVARLNPICEAERVGFVAAAFKEAAALHPSQFASDMGIEKIYRDGCRRSEEHTSELQSLMRTSYAVFCLKTK